MLMQLQVWVFLKTGCGFPHIIAPLSAFLAPWPHGQVYLSNSLL